MHKKYGEDHYGLEKVKERIIEFLAVQKIQKMKTRFVFSWTPGVGKPHLENQLQQLIENLSGNFFRGYKR